MSQEDAAAVVQKLKESGAEYRLGDNGTSVLAPQGRVDELRLQLAAAGLPKTGRVGFELFDRTNLGMTDFAEHVNYRRALEGELERSIRSIAQIEQARVHITFAKDSVFLESREPAKASVLVDVRPGAALDPQNVTAIANFVASSVEGLSPTAVSIVDMRGNLLNRPRQGTLADGQMSDAALDYKHQIERDLAAKVESTLEPLLGPGKFRVGVSVDCDFSTLEQSEEIYDPTRSVMANSQVSEDSTAGPIQTAGIPGTQANSARPPAKPPVAASGLSRRTENVAYDTTRTVRHVKVPQGAIKRISASVLLDQAVEWRGSGKARKRVLVPIPADRMNAIHDLVAGALGLVKDRDQLVLESLPFEQTVEGGAGDENPSAPLPAPAWKSGPRLYIGAGIGIAVLLGIAAVLLLKRRRTRVEIDQSVRALASSEQPVAAVAPAAPAAPQAQEQPPLALDRQLPPVNQKVELVRDRLKESVKSDPVFAANILRGWLEEDAAKARQ